MRQPGPAAEDRHRFGCRRDLRDPRLRRRVGGVDPRTRATGIGQKVDCSPLGGQIRLMGWTLTTAMWRDRDPVTGQARITGTAERPGISASFNDRDGKPLVFQLQWLRPWRASTGRSASTRRSTVPAFRRFGRRDRVRRAARDAAAPARRIVRGGPARRMGGAIARRRHRRGPDQHAARSLERLLTCSPMAMSPKSITRKHSKRLKVHGSPWHFSETPARIGVAPELGADNDQLLGELGYGAAEIADLRERKVI